MVKTQKKRNKKYSGIDAKSNSNTLRVHRVNAVVRSDFRQWVHDRQKLLRYVSIGVLIAAIIAFFVINAVLTAQ